MLISYLRHSIYAIHLFLPFLQNFKKIHSHLVLSNLCLLLLFLLCVYSIVFSTPPPHSLATAVLAVRLSALFISLRHIHQKWFYMKKFQLASGQSAVSVDTVSNLQTHTHTSSNCYWIVTCVCAVDSTYASD